MAMNGYEYSELGIKYSSCKLVVSQILYKFAGGMALLYLLEGEDI